MRAPLRETLAFVGHGVHCSYGNTANEEISRDRCSILIRLCLLTELNLPQETRSFPRPNGWHLVASARRNQNDLSLVTML